MLLNINLISTGKVNSFNEKCAVIHIAMKYESAVVSAAPNNSKYGIITRFKIMFIGIAMIQAYANTFVFLFNNKVKFNKL